MGRRIRQVWVPVALVVLTANSAYLAVVGDPSLFRVVSGLIHFPLGLALAVLVYFAFRLDRRKPSYLSVAVAGLTAFGVATGILLLVFGNQSPQASLLAIHVMAVAAGVAAALVWVVRRARFDLHRGIAGTAVGLVIASVLLAVTYDLFHEPETYDVVNPAIPPADMAGESFGGAEGPFFPSSAFTRDADTIPGTFFSRSESCGRSGCHPDIVEQWKSSAHRFSSFNNQWYRKSIEYMQEVRGVEAPKWCAGCHDHALLFSGQMAQPVDSMLELPEAHAGTGCMSCHSIRSITGTMGNGGIEIAYPFLHEIATSDNWLVQMVHDFGLRIDPEPHRRAFLNPLHRRHSPEFCSTCHKIHLDVPVNDYRWVRGSNTYDNWQSSGISGQGTRSFYAPDVPLNCNTCHMPLVSSDDAGNRDGFVHSHRFIAANTALPTANRDSAQLAATIEFLQDNRLSVDIFAVSAGPAETAIRTRDAQSPTMQSTTFAVGEEGEIEVGIGGIGMARRAIIAPLRSGLTAMKRQTSVRVDVVVRSQSVGHFFPTGTVDAQEAWLEFKVLDGENNVLFWSGAVADEGRGKVDEAAHFYRSRLVDAHGNPINKRNAWAARSTVYVNLIPPGAADVAHYRFTVPADSPPSLRLVAALKYRKFDWWHNQFAYAGEPAPGQDTAAVTSGYDDRTWLFTHSTENVSGGLKSVPVLPIVTLASDTLRLRVGSVLESAALLEGEDDAARWNDYGIALLREGDLRGAARAFRRVTELDAEHLDGWINLARVYLREGNLDAAFEAISEVLGVDPIFPKALYFRGLVHKAMGDYHAAILDLEEVAWRFPKDRVVLREIGRVRFLDGTLTEARNAFESVLQIDPEDVGAHYYLMLIHRALGNEELATEHEARYNRFKADENTSAIGDTYRQLHPFDDNEALAVHEHGTSYIPSSSSTN